MTQKLILHELFSAGLEAVSPNSALLRHLTLRANNLILGQHSWDLTNKNIIVLGAGKGAAPMAQALEELLAARIRQGLVIVKYDHGLPLKHIKLCEAAHPVPDQAGLLATQEMLKLATQATEHDLVICVFTGGASALTPAPVPPITLADLQLTTNLLLACGATIQDLNTVRKHLSLFSGGQLAKAVYPAPLLSLIVSDVIGDPLDIIASGPTTPDPSTFQQALHIIQHFKLTAQLPPPVLTHLTQGLNKQIPETPKLQDPQFSKVHNTLIATNIQALNAIATKAEALGYKPRILTDSLSGEAREVAKSLILKAQNIASQPHQPTCLLAGGETTVTLHGSGKGGRNQEMALTASLMLQNQPKIAALFAGTDGTDGPTNAAGGFACSTAISKLNPNLQQAQALAQAYLDNNDSYYALDQVNNLYTTGPTRTNVMDISIILID